MMGSQVPSVRIAPKYAYSDSHDAELILQTAGIVLDEWQSDILCDWMGRSESGRWSATTCGGSVPRQNGKTLLLQVRMIAGMVMFNEQVVYTSHLQKTSTETFNEMRDIFDAPSLKKYVKEVKTALGREEIILKAGAKVKFLARTRNGGRGQHGDLLVIDEAQEIDSTAQASFLPAISASLNPQTIYVGTPPDPSVTATVFKEIRRRVLQHHSKKTAWFEYSVDEIGDIHNPDRWAATNPALGKRILFSTIQTESEQMDDDEFARERLGWWSEETENEDLALDTDRWKACASEEKKPEGKTAYGVKFSADATMVYLCGAVIPADEPARISVIDIQPTARGLQWLADWLNARYHEASCVVIDGKNGVDLLIDKISKTWRLKNSVIRCGSKEMIAAVSMLTNEVNEGTLTWYKPQDVLNESATTSVKRKIGSGYGFGGDNCGPIEACALALWGARTSKRDPHRKMRIG